jgi:hypothetical protein
LTAHGTDPDSIDEERFTDICIMWADGVIGNRGILEVLGSLTGAVYNYMRSENQRAYKLNDIIPRAHDYLYPPLTEDQKKAKVNESLLSYLKAKPNVPQKLFGKG